MVKKIITPLLAFAAGAFLAVAFLDVLPEAVELIGEPRPVLMFALVGFLLFFILERFLMTGIHNREHTDHSDHTEALPLLVIAGDFAHNFLDGVVIGLAYLANPVVGFTTALAIAAHEVPQEIADFSILLHLGWAKKKVVLINVLQSLITIPGALLGFYAGNLLEFHLPYLLATVAGIFAYIGASDLIPEIHHIAGHKKFLSVVFPLIASVVLIGFLAEVSH